MAKTGESPTGEGKTGDEYPSVIALPTDTLATSTPAPETTYGIQLPRETVSVQSVEPQLQYGVSIPPATVTTATPEPGVTGTGTAGVSLPTETLTLEAVAPRVGYQSWQINATIVERVTDETATDRALTLAFRVTSEELRNTLRSLKTDEGKVDVLGKDDGGFVAVDRANGGNTYTLTPPVQREPLRLDGQYHVERYEEDLVSQDVGEWNVEVEFVRDADRTDSPTLSQGAEQGATFDAAFPMTFSGAEWGIATRYGTLATDRVDADVLGTGEGGVERFDLTARLTFAQAHVFEAALSRLGGGRVRQIPDAPNVVVDDTTDDAATVTLDTPDTQDEVSDGEYVVIEFESTRLTDAYQEVTFTVAST